MNNNYKYLFAIPFYYGLHNNNLEQIRKEFEYDELKYNGQNYSSFLENENRVNKFSPTLLKEIAPLLLEFGNHCSTRFKGSLSNHWIQEYKENNLHPSHIHQHSIISCVYYLRAKNASNIKFKNPNVIQSMNNINLEYSSITPEEGSLLMFPSWLYHEVEEVKEVESERLVVAFNVE